MNKVKLVGFQKNLTISYCSNLSRKYGKKAEFVEKKRRPAQCV